MPEEGDQSEGPFVGVYQIGDVQARCCTVWGTMPLQHWVYSNSV